MNHFIEFVLNPRSVSTLVLITLILIIELIQYSKRCGNDSPELKELKEIRLRLVLIALLIFCK